MAESVLWTALLCALILRLGWHRMHLSAIPSWMLLIPGGRHFPGWERWGWSIKGMLIAKWAGKANRLKSVVSWNLVLGSQNQVGGGHHFKGGYVTPERKSYASSCLVSWNLAAMDLKGSQIHWMLLKPGRNSFSNVKNISLCEGGIIIMICDKWGDHRSHHPNWKPFKSKGDIVKRYARLTQH